MAERKAPPVIRPDVTYPLELVRASWFPNKAAWLQARRQGIGEHVFYVGRRGYIEGSDLQGAMKKIGRRRHHADRTTTTQA